MLLKKKRFQEQLLDKTENQISNLERMVNDLNNCLNLDEKGFRLIREKRLKESLLYHQERSHVQPSVSGSLESKTGLGGRDGI